MTLDSIKLTSEIAHHRRFIVGRTIVYPSIITEKKKEKVSWISISIFLWFFTANYVTTCNLAFYTRMVLPSNCEVKWTFPSLSSFCQVCLITTRNILRQLRLTYLGRPQSQAPKFQIGKQSYASLAHSRWKHPLLKHGGGVRIANFHSMLERYVKEKQRQTVRQTDWLTEPIISFL